MGQVAWAVRAPRQKVYEGELTMRDGFAASASLDRGAVVKDDSARLRSHAALAPPTETRATPTAWQLVVQRTMRELGRTRLTFEQVR